MKIIVIGAGPIGLWTAILLKLEHYEVTVYDKRETYSRSHILTLSSDSFQHKQHPVLDKFIVDLKNKSPIKTLDLENELKNKAKEVGVNIIYNYEINGSNIHEVSKPYDLIICADGAHSKMRTWLFEDQKNNKKSFWDFLSLSRPEVDKEFMEKSELNYVVEVKYKAKNKPRPGKKIKSFSTGTIGSQNVSDFDENGILSATLRIFVDKTTYDIIRPENSDLGTFSNPWSLNQLKLDTRLENIHSAILNFVGDTVIFNEKITALSLNIYKSKSGYAVKNDRYFALVGDANSGVPFFRSLNKGTKESYSLVETLAGRNYNFLYDTYSTGILFCPEIIKNLMIYDRDSFKIYKSEKIFAKAKNYVIYMGQLSVKSSKFFY